MGTRFWLKQIFFALLIASALLFVVELAKGHESVDAARFVALWGVLSTALFTLVGYIRYKRNPACMLPRSDQ